MAAASVEVRVMATEQLEMSDDEAFAIAVVDLYSRIRNGIKEEAGVKIPDDVAAVAFPLATFREALAMLSERVSQKPEPGKVKRSGLIPALHLLDALLRGTEHPIWRYSKAIAPSHRRPPSEVEVTRRIMAVGLLRALMHAGFSENRAAGEIASACTKRGIRVTSGQLREWNTEFATTRADDPEPDRCAERFQIINGKISTDTSRILNNGINNFDEFFGKVKR
jgi:hypothetical protein